MRCVKNACFLGERKVFLGFFKGFSRVFGGLPGFANFW